MANAGEGIALFTPNPQLLTAWYESDRQRVEGYWRSGDAEKLKAVLAAEWEEINGELQGLLSQPDYEDPDRHYRVFSAERYGQVHVLGLAKLAREKLLMEIAGGGFAAGGGTPPADFYPHLLSLSYLDLEESDRFELGPSDPEECVRTEQVKETLNGLDLPDRIFDQYRVNLLPFYIKYATGLSFSSSLPITEEQAIISAAEAYPEPQHFPFSTITHEFGHFVHQQYLGSYEENRADWEEYLKLRGKKVFKQEGEWTELTEENFAEDFKVLFGGERARGEGHRGSYGDPRQERDKGSALRRYMLELLEERPAGLDLREFLLSAPGANLADNRLAPVSGLGFTGTLVTTRPQVKIQGLVAERLPAGIVPAYLLEEYDKDGDREGGVDPREIRLSARGENWSFNESIALGGPGVYSLCLGELDRSRPLFKIYYRVKLIYQPLSRLLTPSEKNALFLTDGETGRPGESREYRAAGCADGTYRPDSPVTRAGFIALLVQGRNFIGAAGIGGIISGITDGTFKPLD